MTEQRNQLAALFAACWKDEALKARFMSDPNAVLPEHGIDVPEGIDLNVICFTGAADELAAYWSRHLEKTQ